jgi:hypothetical protein
MQADISTELSIGFSPITALRPRSQNARTHSRRQIRQIADSLQEFGYTNPVLVDRNNTIIAGHGRVEAAKLLGMTQVPTIQLDRLTEDQVRAYVIADNKLAENAGWDQEILAIELEYLLTLEGTDFDVTVTGFEVPEIDLILEEFRGQSQPEDNFLPIDPRENAVSQPGDLWLLGKHRILCGNALHEASYRELMGSKRASAVFSDPPYNVRIDGHATGNGASQRRLTVFVHLLDELCRRRR